MFGGGGLGIFGGLAAAMLVMTIASKLSDLIPFNSPFVLVPGLLVVAIGVQYAQTLGDRFRKD